MESLGIVISWPSRKPREKQSRIHNHHVSLRDKIPELHSRSQGKHPKGVEQGHGGHEETTKAVAWAVFQHQGEGGFSHGHTHGMAVRRPTRFKIEAQMKQEVAHRSVFEAVVFRWDAGSTLFDSFELNSLLKRLDEAAHAPAVAMAQQKHHADEDDHGEEAGAMVFYSPKSPAHNWTQRHSLGDHGGEGEARRLDTVDEMRPSEAHGEDHGQRAVRYNLSGSVKHGHNYAKDDSSSVFGYWYAPKSIGRRSFDSLNYEKPAKGGSHHNHNRWKSLLRTLHLDGANDVHHGWKNLLHTLHLDGANGLFHGFHKSHTQVAPHDLEKTQEERGRSQRDHGTHGDAQLGKELYDGHFERNELPVTKDVDPPSEKEDGHHHHRHPHRHHPHFWKFGFKTALTQPFCRPGHLLSDNEGSDSEDESHKGHKKYRGHRQVDLRAAWASLTANLLHYHHEHKHEHGRQRDHLHGEEHSVIKHHHHQHHHHVRQRDHLHGEEHSVIKHHHHHHHHHVQPEGEDNEMTMHAISMRVARTSFDEKARRLSIEEGGLKAPRNSLETPVWA